MSAFDQDLPPETLAAARRGESAAQAALYRQFERPAYTLARRMVGDPDAAADVLQDAFVNALRSLDQYRAEAPFGHWLRRLVATQALMHLRARRRWQDFFIAEGDLGEGFEAAGDDTLSAALSRVDLERLLATLDPLPRAVLWLYHVEGYSHAEIAESCGKTVSFSKSQLSRAQARLRAAVNRAGAAQGDRLEALH